MPISTITHFNTFEQKPYALGFYIRKKSLKLMGKHAVYCSIQITNFKSEPSVLLT
jgi:hypothetical protein